MTPQDHIRKIDRALDAFLDQQLARDAALLREHGATAKEIRAMLRTQREAYENVVKGTVLPTIVSFVMNRPTTGQSLQ